jgi:hypothetical protein
MSIAWKSSSTNSAAMVKRSRTNIGQPPEPFSKNVSVVGRLS